MFHGKMHKEAGHDVMPILPAIRAESNPIVLCSSTFATPCPQPGFEKVACYREVPLGQEHAYDDKEEGQEEDADSNKENGDSENTLRAPLHGSSLSVMLSRAGAGGSRGSVVSGRASVAGRTGIKGRRRPAAASTLKPKM